VVRPHRPPFLVPAERTHHPSWGEGSDTFRRPGVAGTPPAPDGGMALTRRLVVPMRYLLFRGYGLAVVWPERKTWSSVIPVRGPCSGFVGGRRLEDASQTQVSRILERATFGKAIGVYQKTRASPLRQACRLERPSWRELGEDRRNWTTEIRFLRGATARSPPLDTSAEQVGQSRLFAIHPF
jgi:hypothetical protein